VWLQQHKYARASDEFSRAIELAPDFARAALGLARSHTEAGEYDLASRDWLRLRRMNPTPRYLGEATEQLGAIRVLRKLRFRPHDPALYRELAELHARQGRPVQAVRALGQGLGQTNSDPGLLGIMVDLCRTLDLPEVALAAYEGALKVRPDDTALAQQVSSIREQIEQSMPSATSENPAPEAAPDAPLRPALQRWNEQPYDGKVARFTLEQTAELLLAVIQHDEKQMQAYAELSTVYEYLGRYRDAADILAKGLGVTPGFEAAENQKERLELLDRLEHGLAAGEDRGGAYRRVSELYFKLGEFELSIEYLLKALELNPKDPQSWSNLGFCYLSTGELERAQAALRRGVSLDPSSEELRRRLGEVESLMGDGSPPPAGH
jgi:tetratricopeptide (TPR) repeat protein